MRAISVAISTTMVCAPAPVRADEPGASAVVGGGVTSFADHATRDAAGTGLVWGGRFAFGVRLPVAVELAYVGSGAGVLEGTATDVALRLSPWPRGVVSPFAFAGVGWQHYAAVGASRMTGLRTTDDAVVAPSGAGVVARLGDGVILDVRGTYRLSRSAGIVRDASMDAWEASAALGLEL